jgi:hypothetical protein
MIAAVILTLVATLASVAASGIAWPRQAIRACIWAERLTDRSDDGTPPSPGLPSGRHARSAPLTSTGGAASPMPQAGIPGPPTPRPGRSF